MTGPIIRSAVEADLESIRRIYEHEVLTGTASFEIDPPDLEAIRKRWQMTGEASLPYLVTMIENQVVAFAYALPYRPRPAYRYTVEHSIYVDRSRRRQGIGKQLLNRLVELLTGCGIREIIGIIGDSTNEALSLLTRAPGFIRWVRCRTWVASLIAGWTP